MHISGFSMYIRFFPSSSRLSVFTGLDVLLRPRSCESDDATGSRCVYGVVGVLRDMKDSGREENMGDLELE